jgi:hypothetical protein
MNGALLDARRAPRIMTDMVRWTPSWAVLGAALVACGYRAELPPNDEGGSGGQAADEGARDGSSNEQPMAETPDGETPDVETPNTSDDSGEPTITGTGGSGASDAPGAGGMGGSDAPPAKDIGPAECGDGAGWAFELVDEGLHDHVDAALAVRADGAVFLAYTDVFGVRLASDAGGSWLVESLDDAADGYFAGASLALDAEGTPRITYSRKQEAVVYATRASDGGFALETVDAAGGFSTALALDAGGVPHVTYYSQGRDSVFRYAVRTNTGWSVTTLDEDAFDRDSAIAIDDAGVVHISYYSRALRYVNNAGGDFTLLETNGGLDSAMVLGEDPIIAHCETGVGVLVGSPHSGFEELGYGVETSLAQSDDGALHLAFTVSESGLDYATNESGSFETETITNGAGPWSNSALAIAPDGTPYVAVSTLNGELYLGRRCAD